MLRPSLWQVVLYAGGNVSKTKNRGDLGHSTIQCCTLMRRNTQRVPHLFRQTIWTLGVVSHLGNAESPVRREAPLYAICQQRTRIRGTQNKSEAGVNRSKILKNGQHNDPLPLLQYPQSTLQVSMIVEDVRYICRWRAGTWAHPHHDDCFFLGSSASLHSSSHISLSHSGFLASLIACPAAIIRSPRLFHHVCLHRLYSPQYFLRHFL